MMDPNPEQPNRSHGSRLRALLFRRTVVTDVVQGIIAGSVLAVFTAILIVCPG
jgi:hypothetical protein